MKIYAKQVPPEYQESPLYMWEEWPENVFVFGNRRLNQHDERLEDIRRALDDLAGAWDDLTSGAPVYCNSWIEAVNECMPRDDGREYTRVERLKIAKLANSYCSNYADECKLLCAALELVTGRKYEYSQIRGCCQGDWQNIIYPSEYGREWLERFEAEYFNTGEEWIVDPDGENFSVYVTGWRDEQKRAEIADAAGCDPGDVVLYAFDGWSRTAKYSEVYA